MSKNNKETLQWIKKHLGESTMKNLKEEASIFFQIMRAQNGEGPSYKVAHWS